MVYKLLNEEGDYLDIDTNEDRNLMFTEIALTPEGVNVGWDDLGDLPIEQVCEYYNIKSKR